MPNEIVPGDGMAQIAPLVKKVYEEALTVQLMSNTRVFGSFTRSPEDQKRIDEWRAKYERERKELLDILARATGTVKDILDLHSTDKFDECGGCDFGGYEGDKPSWPCRTVELIAESLKGDK